MTSTPSVQDTSTPRRGNKMASNQSTNLNHLLNFSLPPRESRPASSIPRRSRKTANTQGVWNKERFINAQYRFVMNPTGDYTVHFADPDIYFQWSDILQVIVPRSSPFTASAGDSSQGDGQATCPICLSPPTAPRMTKCGHIYCFPCILHYLSTSENKWARCPICFDSVNAKQLQCVKWYDGPTEPGPVAPRPGTTLEMRLIQRPSITTLALPRSQTWPSDLLPPHQAPFHFLPDVLNFSKFMLATPEYLIAELTRDRDELAVDHRIMAGMGDPLGSYFIEAADDQVKHQIDKAAALENSALQMQIDKAKRDAKDIHERTAMQPRETLNPAANEFVPAELLAARSAPAVAPAGPLPNHPRPQGRQRRNLNPPPPSTSTYYYYQAASGLPIFLHPLDIKILLSHFNSYVSFPNSITVRIEGSSESTVNDDLRKRCKYLTHMPEGADVIFVEADLQDVVGAEGLKNFEGPLRLRAKKREEKMKKDDRAKARAEEKDKENERAALARFTHSPVFPRHEVHPQEFVSLGRSLESDEGSVAASLPQASGAWGQRSFASALHSASASSRSGHSTSGRQLTQEEEWEADAMWHDLEQATLSSTMGGGGGRKKKGSRMVVLGSGPGLRRR